jgi:hypothetical protein
MAETCHACRFREYRTCGVQTTMHIMPDMELSAANSAIIPLKLAFIELICRRSNVEVKTQPTGWCGDFAGRW